MWSPLQNTKNYNATLVLQFLFITKKIIQLDMQLYMRYQP